MGGMERKVYTMTESERRELIDALISFAQLTRQSAEGMAEASITLARAGYSANE